MNYSCVTKTLKDLKKGVSAENFLNFLRRFESPLKILQTRKYFNPLALVEGIQKKVCLDERTLPRWIIIPNHICANDMSNQD